MGAQPESDLSETPKSTLHLELVILCDKIQQNEDVLRVRGLAV